MEISKQVKFFLRPIANIVRQGFKEFPWFYTFMRTQVPWLGKYVRFNFPDRILLEDTILPYFAAQSNLQKILFVGCEWYTKPYENYFKGKEYWTLEIDASKSKYGAQNHIADILQNLSNYVQDNYFDLIISNGVFGWGLNTKPDTEESFAQCFKCLHPDGILVFGWNDTPDFRPFPVLEECENLRKFESYYFPPLATAQYLTPNTPMRHTFNFYIKKVGVGAANLISS
jgi:SAM-dependent methyltransferase